MSNLLIAALQLAVNESPSGDVCSGEVDTSFMCQVFAELLSHVSDRCVFCYLQST